MTWYLGKNNWIQYGFGPTFSKEWDQIHELWIKYRTPDKNSHPILAAINTVNSIVEEYPAPYTLMCSGGVDSQGMMWSWLISGKPFEVVTVRYLVGGVVFNDHDLGELKLFTDRHRIPVRYIDFDIIDFLEHRLKSVSEKYDCDSPQICTYMEMISEITKGTILFSGNFMGMLGGAEINYTVLGLHRYSLLNNNNERAVIPFFFAHDPDLGSAFLPVIQKTTITKEQVYKDAGFPIIPQKKKYNGFEKVKEYYDQFTDRVTVKDRLRYSNQPSKRVFDLLFRYPLHVGRGKSFIQPFEIFE